MRKLEDGSIMDAHGFEDRAVGGSSNPMSLELGVRYDSDEVIADVVLGSAFEGAPGRAHGGIIAAALDDVTGFLIAKHREPAFTVELTVRYLAPVRVEELFKRARIDGRERRKLFISAITVDPSHFATAGAAETIATRLDTDTIDHAHQRGAAMTEHEAADLGRARVNEALRH